LLKNRLIPVNKRDINIFIYLFICSLFSNAARSTVQWQWGY